MKDLPEPNIARYGACFGITDSGEFYERRGPKNTICATKEQVKTLFDRIRYDEEKRRRIEAAERSRQAADDAKAEQWAREHPQNMPKTDSNAEIQPENASSLARAQATVIERLKTS